MNDDSIKILVTTGLLVQAAAIGLGFSSVGWRWPVAGATAIVALGILTVMLGWEPPDDPLKRTVFAAALLALAAAVGHAASPAPAAAWIARAAFGVEALFQILIALFMFFFKMDRLF
jgi:hypothetical protein